MKKLLTTFFILIFLSLPHLASADITTGLAAWWKLDDGSGTTGVDSVGGKNITFTPAPTWIITGPRGGAITLNGTQTGPTTYNTALGDFSVCLWFNSSVNTNSIRIVDKVFNTGMWIGHETAGAANQWGGGVIEGSPFGIFITLVNGSWHHICSIRSGTTHFIYGDGGAVLTSNTVSGSALSASNFIVGSTEGGGSQFTGSIDDIRIYTRALSAADVNELYVGVGPKMILRTIMTLWARLTIF